MKSALLLLICCYVTSLSFAQQTTDSTFVDTNYKEDQFYLSLTYNLLGNIPDALKQSGFSSGVHFGVIKDMPINSRRNRAIGIGLGLSANSYNQNILIEKGSEDQFDYSIIDETEVTIRRNKFTTYLLELPLEFRWRTSTAKDYKFWRIYTGVKLGYVIYNVSKFKGSMDAIRLTNNNDFQALQYGLTISAGYSTWNLHIYYGLNPIFKDTAQLDEASIDINSIKIGLMFYVL